MSFFKSSLGRQRECQAFQRDDAVGTGQSTVTRRPHAHSSSRTEHAEPGQWGLKTNQPAVQKHTHTQGHTTRKVPLWINNTDPHKKMADLSLSIMRCHKQPFSSVVLSGTIKICVTHASLMLPLLLQSQRCYWEAHIQTHTKTRISALLRHTVDHDKASSGCFRSLCN